MEPGLLEGHKDKSEQVVTACVRSKSVELELVGAWDFFDESRYRKVLRLTTSLRLIFSH